MSRIRTDSDQLVEFLSTVVRTTPRNLSNTVMQHHITNQKELQQILGQALTLSIKNNVGQLAPNLDLCPGCGRPKENQGTDRSHCATDGCEYYGQWLCHLQLHDYGFMGLRRYCLRCGDDQDRGVFL